MMVLWATTDPTEGSAKATLTGVCSGVRLVQSRKKQLDAPKSRGPVVEAAAGSTAEPAAAAAAVVATPAAAATGAAATADAAAIVATSKWLASMGVGASQGGSTSGRCHAVGSGLVRWKAPAELGEGTGGCCWRCLLLQELAAVAGLADVLETKDGVYED
ncbi:unnamed protein product [Closterium sp. NIES-53]